MKCKDAHNKESFLQHTAQTEEDILTHSYRAPVAVQLHSSQASFYGCFTTVCLGKEFRPVSFPLLSALLGDMNGRLGPEQKADHGSIGGDK